MEKVAYRNKDEWIAVPIPDAGIPLEWVEAARAMLAQCRSPSRVDGRFWELSGALMRCGECGRAMEAMVKTARKKSGGKYVFCYYRCREGNRRRETCSNNRCIRSDRAHAAVWGLISELLSEPERLREGLEAMIEEERKGMRGDPERESKAWLQKLAEVDRKRDGYLELAAEGFLGREELRAKLAALEETRETAERELRRSRAAANSSRTWSARRMPSSRDTPAWYPRPSKNSPQENATGSTGCCGLRWWRTRTTTMEVQRRLLGRWVGDRGLITDVIAPPTDAEGGLFSEINDNSVAILLTYGTARILLAGDAEANEEEYMANGPYTGPLTMVKVQKYITVL